MIMHGERYTEPVSSVFAGTLERELADANARADALQVERDAAVTCNAPHQARRDSGVALNAVGGL